MDGLVKTGVITQAQEDAINKAITKAKEDCTPKADFKKGHKAESKTDMDSHVKEGTLQHGQEDALQGS